MQLAFGTQQYSSETYARRRARLQLIRLHAADVHSLA